jgi:hypothetical protein
MPTAVACATLKEHLAAHPASQIAREVFHGFTVTEYLNVLDVVSSNFDVDLAGVDPDVRAHIAALKAARS